MRLVVIYTDGTSEARNVGVRTDTGEISSMLEQIASPPKPFSDQFNPTEIPADHGLEGLSELLERKA